MVTFIYLFYLFFPFVYFTFYLVYIVKHFVSLTVSYYDVLLQGHPHPPLCDILLSP